MTGGRRSSPPSGGVAGSRLPTRKCEVGFWRRGLSFRYVRSADFRAVARPSRGCPADAAAVNDPQVKRMMLVMAAGYERLAAHAVCLEQSGLPHEGARADFQLKGVRGTPRCWCARRSPRSIRRKPPPGSAVTTAGKAPTPPTTTAKSAGCPGDHARHGAGTPTRGAAGPHS